MNRFCIRAVSGNALEDDIVRVVEQELLEPWRALEEFVAEMKHTRAGWDRYRTIRIELERVS